MAEKKRTYNFNKMKLFIIIGVLAYATVTFFNQQTMLAEQKQKTESLLARETELKQQIEYYQNELNYIGTDDYVEKEARERLGWLKEGETKYVEAADGTVVPEESALPQTEGEEGSLSGLTPQATASETPTEASAAPTETPTETPSETSAQKAESASQ